MKARAAALPARRHEPQRTLPLLHFSQNKLCVR